ncbi:ABC transporter permease [Gracilibacillus sp. JCM 18860]|uniref:ABC transporter permease n=1 Tax=Gracilibacillus sp. JCM 18860 TaxID=1306159 RepID=UPI0006D00782
MAVGAIVKRIVSQFKRDKRSLALMLLAPMLLLFLVWLVFNGSDYKPLIGYDNLPNPIIESISDNSEELLKLDREEAISLMKSEELDAYISMENEQPAILLEGSDSNKNSTVMQVVEEALQSMDNNQKGTEPKVEFLYGSSDLGLFDRVGPVLIGFFVFFFVFILGGISFLRERTQGTLVKLLSTPIKRWQLVVGYVVGFGTFTILQSILIVLFSVYILDMHMVGYVWELLIVTILLAITALTLAILLSTFANNEFQIMQFIPIVIIPQVFFSGIFNLDTLDKWIQILSNFMPLTYGGADALSDMMIKGYHLQDVWFNIVVLCGFALVFFLLNIVVLKKHRTL